MPARNNPWRRDLHKNVVVHSLKNTFKLHTLKGKEDIELSECE